MTFENFTRLTHATLLNEPFVSSFYNIVFDPHRVKRGDLFIGSETEDIKIALAHGAYAILSDRKLPILDEEIAWLRTENIEQVLISLLRYHIMEEELQFYYFDAVSAALLQKIASREHLIFLGADLQTNFQRIMQAPANVLFISSDERLLTKITPRYQTAETLERAPVTLTRSTLFLCTLYFEGTYYENLRLPALFLPRLQKLLSFLESVHIPFDLHKCDFTPYFYPIFVNKELQRKAFGTTPSVLIAVASAALLDEAKEYIATHAPWAKRVCFIPSDLSDETVTECTRYRDLSEIERLKEVEFNFAIINDSLQNIMQCLQNLENREQRTLF